MSWHYSQALVEEYSQATCSDSEQFALLKSTTTPEAYCWRDKTTEYLDLFQFGMTSQPSMEDLGAELLNWYLEGSPAQTSALPVQCGEEMELTENQADSGANTCESLTKSSQKKYSVKTPRHLEAKDLTSSFESFPKEGMFANGLLSELVTSGYLMPENDFGFTLPTPTTRDWKDTPGMNPTRADGKTRTDRLPMLLFSVVRSANLKWKTMTSTGAQTVNLKGLTVEIAGKDYSPELPEWLMMWPEGWTDLEPLEMDKYLQWRQSLIKYLNMDNDTK